MKSILGIVSLAVVLTALAFNAAGLSAAPSGIMARQDVPSVSITSNPSNVSVEFSVMPLDAVRVFRNEKPYVWEKDSLVEQDYSNVKNAVALVCTRTVTKTEGMAMAVGNANISGIRKPDKSLSEWIRKGRLYPVGVASFGFDKFYVMRDPKEGRPMGYVSEGAGTIVLVWFIPGVSADYLANELGRDPVGIRIQ